MHPIFDEESIPSVSYPTKGNRGVEKGGCLGWRFQLAIFYTETETFAQKARDQRQKIQLPQGSQKLKNTILSLKVFCVEEISSQNSDCSR